MKLLGNAGNSGVQFRSKVQDDAESVAGYQARHRCRLVGETLRRARPSHPLEAVGRKPRQKWRVEPSTKSSLQGTKIQTRINGQLCVDLDDSKGERRGIFALQIHSGEAMEVAI